MKRYVSIDIGGTAIKYGVIDEDAKILFKRSMHTEAWKGGAGILEKLIHIVEGILQSNDGPIEGIGISTAGIVDTVNGCIVDASPTLPDYEGTQIKKVLEEKFQIPCEVENDVNCAGLAEYKNGAARGTKIAVVLTIGTGIGGCLLLDGKVFHGVSNSACEVGLMHMDGSDFQTLGAASILTKKVSERKKEPKEVWNGYHIFEEAKKGDQVCIEAIDEMADILGKGIANVCYVVNPEVVVLGGGIMAQEGFLRERIEKALKKYLISSIEKDTKIMFAENQNDAGMLGAYYNFREVHK